MEGHIKRHDTHREIFRCPKDCDKQYATKQGLNKHIQRIHQERKCICPYCGKAFCFFGVHFSRHIKKTLERDLEEQVYRCTYEGCTKEYRTPLGLKGYIDSRHLRIMFQCDIDGCDAIFYQNASWTQHCQRVHESVEKADFLCSKINKCNERCWVNLRVKAAEGLCCVILSCPNKGVVNGRRIIPAREAPA